MYQVIIVPRETSANLSFSYKSKSAADEVYKAMSDKMLGEKGSQFRIEDDFGFQVTIDSSDIVYALFVDVKQGMYAAFEKDMVQSAANKELEKRLAAMGFKPQSVPNPSPANGPVRSNIIRG